MTKRSASLIVATLVMLLLAPASRATLISIVLTQTSQSAPAGTTVEFDATLTNLSATDTVFLNGDSTATSSLFLTIDDSPFFLNAPFFLDPGASSGPFALFDVIIDAAAPTAVYDFNFFQILGGLDGSASDTIGSAVFAVNVSAPSRVPEPATLWLLAAGVAGVRLARGSRPGSRKTGNPGHAWSRAPIS